MQASHSEILTVSTLNLEDQRWQSGSRPVSHFEVVMLITRSMQSSLSYPLLYSRLVMTATKQADHSSMMILLPATLKLQTKAVFPGYKLV